MGLKKSPIPLTSGLKPFARPKGILLSSQLSRPMFVGSEMKGVAGDPVWQKVNPDKIRNNPSNSYLNHGDPEGKQYSVGEADVSIRSGWFYHDNQEPKSLRELMDIYFKSVGRGTPLLLNIPPNQDGKFADADVARLKEFRQTLDQLYSVNYAAGALVEADSTRRNSLYKASHLTDGDEKDPVGLRLMMPRPDLLFSILEKNSILMW